jgi:hypothetical protein
VKGPNSLKCGRRKLLKKKQEKLIENMTVTASPDGRHLLSLPFFLNRPFENRISLKIVVNFFKDTNNIYSGGPG